MMIGLQTDAPDGSGSGIKRFTTLDFVSISSAVVCED
jgi:hypothetical protein